MKTYWDHSWVWDGASQAPSDDNGILRLGAVRGHGFSVREGFQEAMAGSVVLLHPGQAAIKAVVTVLKSEDSVSLSQLVLILSSEPFDEGTDPNFEVRNGSRVRRVVFVRDPDLLTDPVMEDLLRGATCDMPEENLPSAFQGRSAAPRRLLSFAILLQGWLDLDDAAKEAEPVEWWRPAALGVPPDDHVTLKERLVAEVSALKGVPREAIVMDGALESLWRLSELPFGGSSTASTPDLENLRDSLLKLLRESWLK